MMEEKYYKPCSTCHNADCVWMGGQDTHKKCEDYQALEQEHCEDCISRQVALDLCERFDGCVPYSVLSNYDMLPPVTVEPKAGHWIDMRCDQCGQVDISKPNYCPNCGAKMSESEKQ